MNCSRCKREITHDGRVCGIGDLHGHAGLMFPCVPEDDKTVIRVDDLLIKTGREVPPVLDAEYG